MNIDDLHPWHSVTQIQEHIGSLVASVCQIPIEVIDYQESLLDFGINSIVAAQINARVEQSFSMELPFDLIAGGASINDVASYFYDVLSQRSGVSLLNDNVVTAVIDEKDGDYFSAIELLKPGVYDIRALTKYRKIFLQKVLFKKAQVELPYYRRFDSASTDTIIYENKQFINFASYNYLGYNDDPRVNAAAIHAIERYGTSAASSRLVSGEKRIHHELEMAIKALYRVEDALVFVSGYLTNISVISHLMDRNDLIIHDSLAHNSIVLGCQYSSAKRLKFPHNDMKALDAMVKENRLHYEHVLIVVEGLYSMDGDTAPLAELVAIKKRYKCLLMVDEAHSIGVLGERGLGIREHCQVEPEDVDIWMGTLSKSFAGCGGYIAGCAELIFYLKYAVPGMIFSVGMAPPLAAASLKAIELLQTDNQRVKQLQHNSRYLLSLLQHKGLNTGLAEGHAIIPCIVGHSLKTAKLANALFYNGINVQSITYPGVDEDASRLRFFVSALHTESQLNEAASWLERCFVEYES